MAVEFVARGSLPSTAEEWLGLLAAIGVMIATYVLVQVWAGRSAAKELDALEARFVAESAQFKSRWPAQVLWQAPYLELEAEAERSWRVVFVLERRRDLARRGRVGDFDAQIAAVRSWITTVVNAMNNAASRGR
ncbi:MULTISPECIES: hypothetical protein [Mycolicibacterium]|uniref:Uncharacterized protein n=1 Tax=Mycolicibacterium senegalense TaxID=1796 RepID=A0A378W530_9MYCO|nr:MULTISPECIES: hypothetical protein [Mycolicibacterium]MCV7333742.1 hypothetical protein [Mycolicibacterium senegalense]MDR7288218.1 hypothetical protein [Mycolicibacterium senegalense]QZA25186.1 hypothetical protein K3U95_03520 [Mycolicibacterium senegalense]CDP85918.1 hypothetical protein BN975_02565 [Mycolicibacterium farcinogenes]SUA28207.1 Uncharacterised protein [Mycolicibacterium senegalense]